MSNYIDPLDTVAAHLLPGTNLAEDPTPAWAAGTFAIGDERHVVATHRVYKCAMAGASAVSPELDAERWKDMRPTNLWAPFDEYTDTPAESTTQDITYVLASRYVNSVALYGLVGRGVVVSVKDAPGGTEIFRFPPTGEARLKTTRPGYWQYAYGQRTRRKTLLVTGIPIAPAAEITVTVAAAAGQPRALGMLVRGSLRSLIGAGWGGVLPDATVVPKTYTYRSMTPDGRQRITRRGSSRDLEFSVVLERMYADAAVEALSSLLSRPVAWVVCTKPGFAGLTAFGILRSGPVRYQFAQAFIDCSVEGYV